MPQDHDRGTRETAYASDLQRQIDEIYDRYRQAWQGPDAPRIEAFVEVVPREFRRRLLIRLVSLDVESRWRHAHSAETVDRTADDSGGRHRVICFRCDRD